MGGHDRNVVQLNAAERYQPETNHERRSDANCTTLYNRIYICGGYNDHEWLATAEFYSAETNQWTMIHPMNRPHSGIGVIAYAGHVFAVGGFDGGNRLRSAEIYNTDTNMWNPVTPRSNFGIEVINNHLFIAGGVIGFTAIFNVEYYDVRTKEWSAACEMGIVRRGLSCCVVYGLPNLADYTVPRDVLALSQMPEEQEESEST